MGYALHPEVYGDLEEIHYQLERFSSKAADQVLDELLDAFDLLLRFPGAGHLRTDLTSLPIRFKVVRRCLIAYWPNREPLWIVAVVDGRRNPRVIAGLLRSRE
jgi:plasmid stabilization system protein ParE